MAGRGVGARPGDRPLNVIESANLVDDRSVHRGLRDTSRVLKKRLPGSRSGEKRREAASGFVIVAS